MRLKYYDYAQQGAYFVTVCVNDRKCVFGDVLNDNMVLNDAGKMVDKWWRELSKKYNVVLIDEHKIMPNHLHGIIVIVDQCNVGADLCVRPVNGNNGYANNNNMEIVKGRTRRCAPTPMIGTIVQWFKTMSTNEYIRNVKTNNWPPFIIRLWQRNYYEHVIRDESDLVRIREYIVNNPVHWERDEYYA
ncbi:MAG: transposase [Candidatus Omnitrophota bacterium]